MPHAELRSRLQTDIGEHASDGRSGADDEEDDAPAGTAVFQVRMGLGSVRHAPLHRLRDLRAPALAKAQRAQA